MNKQDVPDYLQDIIPKLKDMAKEAASKAYSPYSNVKVGSALVTDTGTFHSGCNIENSSYGGTVCAERVAVFNAVSGGSRKISALYVYTDDGWPPCGICRQVMSEFAAEDMLIVIGNKNNEEKIFTLAELLPLSFTSNHLKK